MSKDYYTKLGLNENASEDDIRKALKRFSDEKIKEVTEAYEILCKKKRLDASGPSSYQERRREDRTNAERDSFLDDSFGPASVNETSEVEIHVTLEEVYNGCTKKVKLLRRVIPSGEREQRVEEKAFTIEVKPGWKAGTRITFHREGNQIHYGSAPGDLVFVIRDKPHPQFCRDGVDIRYVAKITFKEAMRGGYVEVPTLTKGKIIVPLTDIVTPTTVKRISGHGLPHPKDPTTRGDLLLSFDIECPRYTTEAERQLLWDALCPFI